MKDQLETKIHQKNYIGTFNLILLKNKSVFELIIKGINEIKKIINYFIPFTFKTMEWNFQFLQLEISKQ